MRCDAMPGATGSERRCESNDAHFTDGDGHHLCGHHYLYPAILWDETAADLRRASAPVPPPPPREPSELERNAAERASAYLAARRQSREAAVKAHRAEVDALADERSRERKRIAEVRRAARAKALATKQAAAKSRPIPRRQTRRSVSVSGALHLRLRAHCDSLGQPVAAFVEQLILDALADVPPCYGPARPYYVREPNGPPASGVVTL